MNRRHQLHFHSITILNFLWIDCQLTICHMNESNRIISSGVASRLWKPDLFNVAELRHKMEIDQVDQDLPQAPLVNTLIGCCLLHESNL
ncbi:hypothetical protein BLOT_007608 [Blomia tropicalis]|nr:hypothetical protein BLOT_007608 [Blomia tropicalis]